MRFNCEFFNGEDEIREVVVALTAAECESVEGVRQKEGEEQALLIARCYALKSAYQQVDPLHFSHTSPPQEIRLS
jgi:hypothetical protein